MILAEIGNSLGRVLKEDGSDLDSVVIRAWVKIEVESNGQTFHIFDYKRKEVANA